MHGPDDGLSSQNRAFLKRMKRIIRRGVVSDLLAGNDTCCFTTRQYAERYSEHWTKGIGPISDKTARLHLLSIGVVEVRPDVWTRKEIADART